MPQVDSAAGCNSRLHEGDQRTAAGDDVHLTGRRTHAAIGDAPALQPQPPACDPFSPSASGFGGLAPLGGAATGRTRHGGRVVQCADGRKVLDGSCRSEADGQLTPNSGHRPARVEGDNILDRVVPSYILIPFGVFFVCCLSQFGS